MACAQRVHGSPVERIGLLHNVHARDILSSAHGTCSNLQRRIKSTSNTGDRMAGLTPPGLRRSLLLTSLLPRPARVGANACVSLVSGHPIRHPDLPYRTKASCSLVNTIGGRSSAVGHTQSRRLDRVVAKDRSSSRQRPGELVQIPVDQSSRKFAVVRQACQDPGLRAAITPVRISTASTSQVGGSILDTG